MTSSKPAHRSTWKRPVGLLLLVIALYLIFSAGYFRGSQICDVCGSICETHELYGLSYRGAAKPRPITNVLLRRGIVGTHAHHWLGIAGSGLPPFGPMCGVGNGRYLLSSTRSVTIVPFLDQLAGSAGPTTASPYASLALNTASPHKLEYALSYAGFPDNGFASMDEFARWWATNQAVVDNELAGRP